MSHKKRSKKAPSKHKKSPEPELIRGLSWEEFWELVGEGTRKAAEARDEAQRIALQNASNQILFADAL